jgi:glycosyltransferase involved in cell wall biosynthesis
LLDIFDKIQVRLKKGSLHDKIASSRLEGHFRKRILIACSHFWPSIGGLESRIEQFSFELLKAGYDVSIMTPEYPGRDSDVYRGVRIISINPREKYGIVQAWPYMVRKYVISGQFEACIMIQEPLAEIIWSLEGVTHPLKTKLIIQPIINADGYSRWKDNKRFCQRLACILKNSTAVVSMTKTGPDLQFMVNNGITPVYIPNATIVPETTRDFRKKYDIHENCFIILHVANLYWVKNHIGLIDTLHELPDSWKLVLIGNPTGEPDCAKAVISKLEKRSDILYVPGLNRDDVSAAMEAADVIVLSSFGEGSPNTILEAMSHKKPWLATPQCGAANDNAGGIICPLAEFFDHLSVLQEFPELRSRLGEIGYQHWQECFSWPKVIDVWISLIEARESRCSFTTSSQIHSEMGYLRGVISGRLEFLKH